MDQASRIFHAGMVLSAFLLAVTVAHSQQIRTSNTVETPKSIISLASAPGPEGDLLARHVGDATFAHAPANYHVFAAANVGIDAGVDTLTLKFAGETRLTAIQSKNRDFVVEPGGTCHEGNVYSKGGSCTLLVRFTPQGPGHRLGFITVSNTTEATPMSFGLTGNGYAPVVSFTPSLITTVAPTVYGTTGTISGATNVAIDGGDILYIADIGNNKIKEIDSGGVLNTISPAFATPASLAVDSLGILYTANVHGGTYYFSEILPWGTQTSYGYTYAPGSCTPGTPCAFSAVGMNYPANMSIDANDNLIFEEGTQGAAEMPVANVSQGTGTLSLWYLKNQFIYTTGTPASFAADANGNLYNSYNYTPGNTCFLMEETLYAAEYSPSSSRVAGGIKCGFSGDGSQARGAEISSKIGQIAFDVAGNLYFADAGNQRVRRIEASSGIISTIAGNGTAGYTGDGGAATNATLSNPTGVAVDSQGQVFILSNAPTAGPTQVLRKVGNAGIWTFSNQLKGTPSAAKVFTVSNTGNDSLVLLAVPSFSGATPADFSIDPATTNCVLTAGAVLTSGRSCYIGIVFKPSAAGSRSASLRLVDNTLQASNTINLSGTGTLPTPTMSITSPAPGSSVKTGVTVTFSVTVTTTATTKPTGTVTFKANNAIIGSPVTLTSGSASTTFSEPSASTYTLSAVYSGDANYATATVSESLIVTAVKVPVLVSLKPAVAPLSSCGAMSFSSQVASSGGGIPGGTLDLLSGSTAVASATLSRGAATLSTHALSPGQYTFVASYRGDALHQPAESAPVSVSIPFSSCTIGHRP